MISQDSDLQNKQALYCNQPFGGFCFSLSPRISFTFGVLTPLFPQVLTQFHILSLIGGCFSLADIIQHVHAHLMSCSGSKPSRLTHEMHVF